MKNPYRNHTIEEFYPVAMKVVNQHVVSHTAKDRIGRIERHIIPTLGNIKIKDLTALKIEYWQFNLFKLRGADQTRRCKTLLKNILNRAIVHEVITANPILATATIREPRTDGREVYIAKKSYRLLLMALQGG